ncbi:hypothetical protein Ahy_A07g036320 [Arachis hypogaea]|uniref:Uncharacterized protein n=1 Tax=Arachis hypogaea TaxID=3818 RepID=A0A445CFW9_ARAHY|nr:hypothetical protein Ahy_A07g036320 [Arachis hypogaea]
MSSDKVLSRSRRSRGGEREVQFAASSVPNEKDFVPWHLTKVLIYFLWLDDHNARLGMAETRYLGEKEIGDVEEHHGKQDTEIRITCLEKRIVALEMKKTQ